MLPHPENMIRLNRTNSSLLCRRERIVKKGNQLRKIIAKIAYFSCGFEVMRLFCGHWTLFAGASPEHQSYAHIILETVFAITVTTIVWWELFRLWLRSPFTKIAISVLTYITIERYRRIMQIHFDYKPIREEKAGDRARKIESHIHFPATRRLNSDLIRLGLVVCAQLSPLDRISQL